MPSCFRFGSELHSREKLHCFIPNAERTLLSSNASFQILRGRKEARRGARGEGGSGDGKEEWGGSTVSRVSDVSADLDLALCWGCPLPPQVYNTTSQETVYPALSRATSISLKLKLDSILVQAPRVRRGRSASHAASIQARDLQKHFKPNRGSRKNTPYSHLFSRYKLAHLTTPDSNRPQMVGFRAPPLLPTTQECEIPANKSLIQIRKRVALSACECVP